MHAFRYLHQPAENKRQFLRLLLLLLLLLLQPETFYIIETGHSDNFEWGYHVPV